MVKNCYIFGNFLYICSWPFYFVDKGDFRLTNVNFEIKVNWILSEGILSTKVGPKFCQTKIISLMITKS